MLLKVLERLDRRRFSPHAISLTTVGEIGPRIEALGIPVEAMEMAPRRANVFAFLKLVRRLKALRPDVVHTWMYHADIMGGLAARLARVSAVGWAVHHSNLDADKNKAATLAVVQACALLSKWIPKRILCCSQTAQQVHVNVGYAASKMVVVPNGFDLVRFQPDPAARTSFRAELSVAPDTQLVGLIGRFDPQKNHAGFFQAAEVLYRRMPGVHFVLAGQGIDANNTALVRAVETAGVASVTHLLSLRTDIPRLMAALDVLASSSDGEAFPNVLGEAMACGVPCAVTDVGDSAYIVGDTGRVVPPGDMPGLADALEELLTLPVQERTAAAECARTRVLEHFEIGQVVRRYEAFYEGLAAQSATARRQVTS